MATCMASLLLLNLLFKVQVAKTQWILLVELHQFHNLYNAEVIKPQGICCCDITEGYENYCKKQAIELPNNCAATCDTELRVYVSHCLAPYPCLFATDVYQDRSSVDNLEQIIFVLSSSSDKPKIILTNVSIYIEALDWKWYDYYDDIDIIEEPVSSLSYKDKVKVERVGSNGIGWFNFTYSMHNLDCKSTPELSVKTVTTTIVDTVSVVESSTGQPQAQTSSAPWAWITVAILFILLSLLFFTISIIAICINRNMLMKLKDNHNKHTSEKLGNISIQHEVDNTLYGVANMEFSADQSQVNSSEMPMGNLYEVTNEDVIRQGAPYEIPVPLDATVGVAD